MPPTLNTGTFFKCGQHGIVSVFDPITNRWRHRVSKDLCAPARIYIVTTILVDRDVAEIVASRD